MPLQKWAQTELLTLTRIPTAKTRWENLAGQIAPPFEFSNPTFIPRAETFLRIFGASDFGVAWLSQLIAQIQPSSPFKATAFRWTRIYGGKRKSEYLQTLHGNDFFRSAKTHDPPPLVPTPLKWQNCRNGQKWLNHWTHPGWVQ